MVILGGGEPDGDHMVPPVRHIVLGRMSHGVQASFGRPFCLLSLQPQPVTASFGDTGELFDGLPLSLSRTTS